MANLARAGAIARGVQGGLQAGLQTYGMVKGIQHQDKELALRERQVGAQEGVLKAKNQYIMATVEQDRVLKRLESLKTKDPNGQDPQIMEQAKKLRESYDLLEKGKMSAFSQIGDPFAEDFWGEYVQAFGGAGGTPPAPSAPPAVNLPR